MKGFVDDIGRLTEGNTDFRRVLYTGQHVQLVLMTLQPGEEIGSEVHEDRDQFFRVEAGDGEITIDGTTHRVTADFAMIVPPARGTTCAALAPRRSSCTHSTARPSIVTASYAERRPTPRPHLSIGTARPPSSRSCTTRSL